MAARRIPDDERDASAETHLRYEVSILVGPAGEYTRRYPAGGPDAVRFKCPIYDDALLESTLVHPRCLDEFASSQGSHRCDARAGRLGIGSLNADKRLVATHPHRARPASMLAWRLPEFPRDLLCYDGSPLTVAEILPPPELKAARSDDSSS